MASSSWFLCFLTYSVEVQVFVFKPSDPVNPHRFILKFLLRFTDGWTDLGYIRVQDSDHDAFSFEVTDHSKPDGWGRWWQLFSDSWRDISNRCKFAEVCVTPLAFGFWGMWCKFGNVVEIWYSKQILQFELFDTFYMNMVLRSDPERWKTRRTFKRHLKVMGIWILESGYHLTSERTVVLKFAAYKTSSTSWRNWSEWFEANTPRTQTHLKFLQLTHQPTDSECWMLFSLNCELSSSRTSIMLPTSKRTNNR